MISKKKIGKISKPRRRSSLSTLNNENSLGPTLQTKRVNLGISQKMLSEMSHLQVATISRIEKGDPSVSLGTLQTYLNILNLKLAVEDKDLE